MDNDGEETEADATCLLPETEESEQWIKKNTKQESNLTMALFFSNIVGILKGKKMPHSAE